MKNNWLERRWFETLVLGIIIGLAAFLRFYKLGEWSYWVDELYSLESALRPFSENLHRPFWLVTKTSLEILGVSAFSLRLFPCIFGIITIPILYFPLKTIFNKEVALFSLFLLAISPWHIYLSQLTRWYSLLLLVSSASLLLFYFYLERNSLKYLIGSAVTAGLAFSLHLTAGFVVMIALTYIFVLSRFPSIQPPKFNQKKVNLFLLGLLGVSFLLLPKFISFVKQWREIQQAFGYWGSTPINFSMKVLYHLTPVIGVLAFAGLILLLLQNRRKGLFFAIYCFLPPLTLNLAAALKTNVSAKYVFFTLPGLLVAVSYLCYYVFKQVNPYRFLAGVMILAATAIPALETDFLYFTTGHGNRDRLQEAVQYIKNHSTAEDKILLLYVFENPEEAKFYFDTMAQLSEFDVSDEQYLFPKTPEEIDLSHRVWIVTIGKQIEPNTTGFYEWLTQHANLTAEFEASRGPIDNTVKIYLHRPARPAYSWLE